MNDNNLSGEGSAPIPAEIHAIAETPQAGTQGESSTADADTHKPPEQQAEGQSEAGDTEQLLKQLQETATDNHAQAQQDAREFGAASEVLRTINPDALAGLLRTLRQVSEANPRPEYKMRADTYIAPEYRDRKPAQPAQTIDK